MRDSSPWRRQIHARVDVAGRARRRGRCVALHVTGVYPRTPTTMEAPGGAGAAAEVAHWKAQAEEMRAALQEAESGLQEFMESSKELEAELEANMAAAHKQVDALQADNARLQAELQEWRVRRAADSRESTSRRVRSTRRRSRSCTASLRSYVARTPSTRRGCAIWRWTMTRSRARSGTCGVSWQHDPDIAGRYGGTIPQGDGAHGAAGV